MTIIKVLVVLAGISATINLITSPPEVFVLALATFPAFLLLVIWVACGWNGGDEQ